MAKITGVHLLLHSYDPVTADSGIHSVTHLLSQSSFRLWKDLNHIIKIHPATWLPAVSGSSVALSPLQPFAPVSAGGAEWRAVTHSHHSQQSCVRSFPMVRAGRGQLQHEANAEPMWVCMFVFIYPNTSFIQKCCL